MEFTYKKKNKIIEKIKVFPREKFIFLNNYFKKKNLNFKKI